MSVLNVLFFASVREQLGVERITCAFEKNIDALVAAMTLARGEQWREVLCQPNIIVAVNHEVVSNEHALCEGDEVAFFPPVTGG